MTTSGHGSVDVDGRRRARRGAGIALLVVAVLPAALLVWMLLDFAMQDYIGSEADLTKFAMVIAAMLTLHLVSSGVALIRSGNSGGPVSRIYLIGLGVLVFGFGGTYLVSNTVEWTEYVDALYAVSLIVGTAAMVVGAFLPTPRKSTSNGS